MDAAWFERYLQRQFPRAEALAVTIVDYTQRDGGERWLIEAEWADTCEYVKREFVFEVIAGDGGAAAAALPDGRPVVAYERRGQPPRQGAPV